MKKLFAFIVLYCIISKKDSFLEGVFDYEKKTNKTNQYFSVSNGFF